MKLKRLYIGDMGIYRNSLMDNIDSKIVVIGGLNRSGKTTFLEILRHLPYGFTKGIRDVKSEYFAEADLIDETSDQYTVKLSSLREPQVTSKGEAISRPIYGTVDKYTYSQLYTITLDELKRSNVKSEEEKLQSVLLGAGLKDIVHIPKLTDEFRKEKEKLGGKQGNPTTKAFKPYYDKLLEGINSREESLKQLQEYENRCNELKILENQIEACNDILGKLNYEITALEIAKSYYSHYADKRSLLLQHEELQSKITREFNGDFPSLERIEGLYEEYKEALNQYEKLREQFENKKINDENFYLRLINSKEQLRSFEKKLSGLSEKMENYNSLKSSYNRDKQQLHIRMNALNSSFREDFIEVIDIDCDSIEQDKLINLVEEYNELEAEKKSLEKELESLKLQKQMLEKEAKVQKASDTGSIMNKYLYVSAGILLAGILLYWLSKPLGAAVALIGITAAVLYFVMNYSSKASQHPENNGLILQMNALSNRIKLQEDNYNKVKSSFEESKNELGHYKNKLKLNREISSMGLLQYFKDIKELKKDILNLGFNGKNLDKLKQEINGELIKANELVNNIEGFNRSYDEDNFKNFKDLCIKIDELIVQLSQAERLLEAEVKFNVVKDKLSTLLNIPKDNVILQVIDIIINQYRIYNQCKFIEEKIENIDRQFVSILKNERIKKALEFIFNEYNIREENMLLSLTAFFDNFNSQEQIDRKYESVNIRIEEENRRLERLKDQKQALSSEIKKLSTSEKLIDAQRIIDEQRAALRQIAVKYSVLSTAEFILETVQKNFIETAKDTILGGAGKIFNKITCGEYKALLPGENLLQNDFKAMLGDGQIQDSVGMLSRGTGEQLFLSVRLNRIKDIKEKLPIVLDDPFVNFDSLHMKNALRVICEMAEDNQIFILTCHSELVELISEVSSQVQYWKLKKGSFELSDSKELVNYLL